jgi:predicted RecB family endonuclease
MTELEALKLMHGWAKEAQPSDEEPQSKQALSMVQELVERVERADADPGEAIEMAQGVMAENGCRMVAGIDTFEVREAIAKKGFEKLGCTVCDETIIEELDRQIEASGGPPTAVNEWLQHIVRATARVLVEKAGLVWPESK